MMKRTKIVSVMIVSFMFLIAALAFAGQQKEVRDSSSVTEITIPDSIQSNAAQADSSNPVTEKIIVYYLHSTHRCATCKKLEAYSHEAIEQIFADKLKNGMLEWRVVNYDEKENEHFVKDYKLYTKALILSRVIDGKEIEWKNLDKIWEFVGNKDKFISYVQNETRTFLNRDND